MKQKRAIITGGTGVIGREVVRGIAASGQYAVTVLCRSAAKGEQLKREIPGIECSVVDQSRHASITAYANAWTGPLDLLICIASVAAAKRRETADGIEVCWATNVLGYYWMITALAPYLKQASAAQVVCVASYWAGELDVNDPEFRTRAYSGSTAYRQSKQAERMLAVHFAEKLAPVRVNSVHPGDCDSPLSNELGFGGSDSPKAGARTPLMVALGNLGSGLYFEHGAKRDCRFSRNRTEIGALVKVCEGYA